MNIVVSGGTGLIGKSLIPALLANGHHLTIISRSPEKIAQLYQASVNGLSWQALNQIAPDTFDAIINLAGENIAEHRWSKTIKLRIKESRIQTTAQLVKWALQATMKKPHLYNASAVGIYGAHPATSSVVKPYTETTPLCGKSRDFCTEVGESWEKATQPAMGANMPVTLLRFGVVLKRHEGILKKLEWPFSLGFGTIIGSGEQSFSWIQIDDLIAGIIFLLNHPTITGPVNLCAPQCVTQKIFAKALATTLHRPLFLTLPARVVTTLFGDMGKELLLSGQKVYPEKLEKNGFHFTYPDLQSALQHEWNKTS